MEEIKTPSKRIEYVHYVSFNGGIYKRTETLSLKHYTLEDEPENLLDLHTIKWNVINKEHYLHYETMIEQKIVEYFSVDIGWSKDGKLDKNNPIPDIEKYFKETVGKDLIYFL